MVPCGICYQSAEGAVSLPCGHIFCEECISRAVEAVREFSTLHFCPTCQSAYSIIPIDPSTVPPQLRPHLIPSVRKLNLGLSPDGPRTQSGMTEMAIENARLHAENVALRRNCQMWRKRAEAHGSTTLNLLRFATLARDDAVKTRQERDELYTHYCRLKSRVDPDDLGSLPPTPLLPMRPPLTPLPDIHRMVPTNEVAHQSQLSLRRRSSTWMPSLTGQRLMRPPQRSRSAEFTSPPRPQPQHQGGP